jgi:uncharacterized protein (DUF2249 family)
VHFVTLADGSPVIAAEDEPQPEGALVPLQQAVEASIGRPYRAEGVRRGPDLWAVAAKRVELVAVPGLQGEEAELVSTADGRSLHVDGQPRFGSVPAFEKAGDEQGPEYVVRARRIADETWEVQAAAL